MSIFYIDRRTATNAMVEIGWLRCPPDLQKELSKSTDGSYIFTARPMYKNNELIIKAGTVTIVIGTTPHFIFPYNRVSFYHMWFDEGRERFYEASDPLCNGHFIERYNFDEGFDRARTIVAHAARPARANTRYQFKALNRASNHDYQL